MDTTNTNDTKNGDWHKKLSPLDTHLQERFQAATIPKSWLLYNKIMVSYQGCSKYTTKVKGKPQSDSFKVWAIAEQGYLFDWLYFSGTNSTFWASVVDSLVLLFLIKLDSIKIVMAG